MTFEKNSNLVITKLVDALQYISSGDVLELEPIHEVGQKNMDNILAKFEAEGLIVVISLANDDSWKLSIYDPYLYPKNYSIKVKNKPALQKKFEEISSKSSNSHSGNKYYLEYTTDGRLMLNGDVELSKPIFDEDNDLIIKYLIENPNKSFTRKELSSHCGKVINKDFAKVIEHLVRTKGFKNLFFRYSKDSIELKNPVYV